MYKRIGNWTIGFALLAASAACGDGNDTGGNTGGSYWAAGTSGSIAGDTALGGAGGAIDYNDPNANVAGIGGVVAGIGGVVAGIGGVVAGSGGVVAGTGGVVAGTGGGGDGGTGGTVDIRPPCLKDPSQVVTLGDSYMNMPSWIGREIAAAAVADGALQPGQTYRDYSAPGTMVVDGVIPGQLDRALADNPGGVKTYIVDGCGNDVMILGLLAGCLGAGASTNAFCTDIIAQCTQAFIDMGDRAKAAGVTDAIVFTYPDNVPGGGAEIAQYGVEQGKTATAGYSTPVFRAYFIDTIAIMQGHTDWYQDIIHVDQRGAQAIAQAIYKVMKDNCIAQPESSGCCEPW
jgi:hypothetical protein